MADWAAGHEALGGIRLVLGGNVFGWTIDRDQGFAVLDAFYECGGRMIDTAEGYSNWVPGNKGGESEAIIGAWMESRGVRQDMRIATKTGQAAPAGCYAPATVEAAITGSLERLRTDHVDLFYIHRDDLTARLDDVVPVFCEQVARGRTRALGVSNMSAARLTEANAIAARIGGQRFSVCQPQYNLVARGEYEGALQQLCLAQGIAALPYYSLASGFLTGKFRSADDWARSNRAFALDEFAANGGWQVLDAMRAIAAETGASLAAIALAWLNSRPGVAAPIASATTPGQVRELCAGATLVLNVEQRAMLEAA